MSKLKESLQLYWKGAKNFDKVWEGFRNEAKLKHGELSDDQVDEITHRRMICESCPFNSVNAKQSIEYQELVGNPYNSSLTELHCSLCSCQINRKTACLTCQCGISEWNENNPNKQLPLKWETYKNQNNEPNSTTNPATDVINGNQ